MQKLILVADDDPTILMMVSDVFESYGYRVLRAETGSEAIITALNSRPDLIISDINMPSGYGSSLYEKLQQESSSKGIPFIFITGVPLHQAKKLITESSKVVLILKPFDMKTLIDTAQKLLAAGADSPIT